MALLKSEALILRVIPFRDTSKILTIYTAEHGLVSILAKGVRGPRPRFGAALELFASSDVVYYQKESRELQLLREAMLLDPHLDLTRDSGRYAYGVAVLEFLLKVLGGQEPPGRLYPLAQKTLETLGSCSRVALETVFRAFELKALSFLGHRPELYHCVECGREADLEPGAGFLPALGGVVCGTCAESQAGVLALAPPVWRLLRRFLTSTLAELGEDPPAALDTAGAGRLMEPFLQTHLERYIGLRSVRMAGMLAATREP